MGASTGFGGPKGPDSASDVIGACEADWYAMGSNCMGPFLPTTPVVIGSWVVGRGWVVWDSADVSIPDGPVKLRLNCD
eukprot:scaffold152044_cov30-Prasinocladus_malaysianus.AAC.2